MKNKISDPYKLARKRVQQKKGFYQHLGAYLAVGIFFLAMNLATFDGDWWFYFPMMGWGIAILIHYFSVFGIPGLYDNTPEWEEKAFQEELKRMNLPQPQATQQEPIVDKELELKTLQKEKAEKPKWEDSELI